MIPNKNGQALVEFVLILPILIIFFLGVIDFGRIMLARNSLINMTNDAVDLYQDELDNKKILEALKKEEDISSLDIIKEDDLVHIKLTKKLILITPGLNLILKNPYKITATRVIIDED